MMSLFQCLDTFPISISIMNDAHQDPLVNFWLSRLFNAGGGKFLIRERILKRRSEPLNKEENV